MPKSLTWQVAQERTGGKVPQILRSSRRKGESYDTIARRLYGAHEVAVTGNTLRTWARDLGIEPDPAAEKPAAVGE